MQASLIIAQPSPARFSHAMSIQEHLGAWLQRKTKRRRAILT
jgi:hypothetical protein